MKKKRNTRLTAKEVIITLLCLAGISAAVILFYKDINLSLNANSEPIGVIYFKQNSAQRRLQNRNLWERIKVSSPIYEGDRIRTGDLSEASAVFNDGSKIDIHENTLIQLFTNDNKVLNFINGTITVVSGSSDEAITVQTGDKLLSFSENTSAVLSIPKKEEVYEKNNKILQQATITVTSGEVSVSAAPKQKPAKTAPEKIKQTIENIGSKPQPVIPEQIISAGTASSVEVAAVIDETEKESYSEESLKTIAQANNVVRETESSKLKVLMPPVAYSVTQKENSKTLIPFFWEKYDDIKIELSYSPAFDEIIETQTFSMQNHKGNIEVDFGMPGDIIYWRAAPAQSVGGVKADKLFSQGKIVIKSDNQTALDESVKTVFDKKAEKITQKSKESDSSVKTTQKSTIEELPKATKVETQEKPKIIVETENPNFDASKAFGIVILKFTLLIVASHSLPIKLKYSSSASFKGSLPILYV